MDKCDMDIHPPTASLSLTLCPPVPPMGAIRPAQVAVMASSILMGADTFALAPFHPPQPSPRGFTALQAGDLIPCAFPTIMGPGGAQRIPVQLTWQTGRLSQFKIIPLQQSNGFLDR